MSHTYLKDGVTFIWAIENFNSYITGNLISPIYLSNSLNETKWQISIEWESSTDYISLALTRCDKGTGVMIIDSEFSIVDGDGLSLKSVKTTNLGFIKTSSWSCKNFSTGYDIFKTKWHDILIYSTLFVRCRLRRSHNKFTQPELLSLHTKIEKSYFVWEINDFCHLKANDRRKILVPAESPVLMFEFYKLAKNGGDVRIEVSSESAFQFSCVISILDCNGQVIESKWGEHNFKSTMFSESPCNQIFRFPSFIDKTVLLKNKRLYLPMNVLSLQVVCFFWPSSVIEENSKQSFPVCENFMSSQPNSNGEIKIENLSLTQTKDKQSMTENLPSPQKFNEESVIENLTSPQKFDEESVIENLPSPQKFDEESVIENLPILQKFDKQYVMENLPSPKKCDKQYMTEYLPVPQKFDKQSMTENLPSPKKFDKQTMTELLVSQKFHKQSMTENLPSTQKFDKQSMTENSKDNVYANERYNENLNYPSLERFVNEIHCMYKEGWLSDFSLRAGDKTFAVHKNILSARSPYFKTMFTSTLKDAKSLVIPEIHEDILHRMLQFVYSNKIEELELDAALGLHFAASKYAIEDLKTITRNILKSKLSVSTVSGILVHAYLHEDTNLKSYATEFITKEDLELDTVLNLHSSAGKYVIEDLKSITLSILETKLSALNVCEVLVHANFHEDKELKYSSMEFIVSHHREIIGTEDWEKFQKEHLHLTVEIFNVLYSRMIK